MMMQDGFYDVIAYSITFCHQYRHWVRSLQFTIHIDLISPPFKDVCDSGQLNNIVTSSNDYSPVHGSLDS